MLRYSTCRSCQCLIRPNHWIERLVLFRNRVLLRMKVNRIVKWFVERAIRTRDTYQLNKSKVVQRCLYSYRQRYSPSQWSKCCGFRRCSKQFASRGQKYQTCLILSSRPRKANFSPKFSRKHEETDEQTASRWSMLSREDKIKDVWYFWPREANSSLCAAIVVNLTKQSKIYKCQSALMAVKGLMGT